MLSPMCAVDGVNIDKLQLRMSQGRRSQRGGGVNGIDAVIQQMLYAFGKNTVGDVQTHAAGARLAQHLRRADKGAASVTEVVNNKHRFTRDITGQQGKTA